MYWPKQRLTICVTGAGEFVGAELAKRLKKDGHYVVACDLKRPGWMPTDSDFCDEFHVVDLKKASECVRVTYLCDHIFHCQNASNGGGRGFVSHEVSKIMHADAVITCNMIEAARRNGVTRFLYVSGSEVYPSEGPCREDQAWKGRPADSHGVTALMGEELVLQYGIDFGIDCRVARIHNVYGPNMPWKDGRETVLAALCRKVLVAPLNDNKNTVEVWGDGTDVRNFLYLDDCVDGLLAVMQSGHVGPINIAGSKETTKTDFTINELVHSISSLAVSSNKEAGGVVIDHVPGPGGVSESRVCDAALASEVLQWEPRVPLSIGLRITYDWMEEEIQADWKYGFDISTYAKSKVIDPFTKVPTDDFAFYQSFASCATGATRYFDWQHVKTFSVAAYNRVSRLVRTYVKVKSS